MDKAEKNFKMVIKILLIAFFVMFIMIYISGSGNYYENELHKKTVFTDEQIKKFEQDVADGKNVSIENYHDNEKKNYRNRTSDLGLFLSKGLTNSVKKGIEKTFKMIAKLVE